MRRLRALVLLLAPIAFAAPVAAQDDGSPDRPFVDPALRARFGFRGPLLRKVEPGFAHLAFGILEQRPRLLVENRRRGRVELWHVAGDGLESTTLHSGAGLNDVRLGDFDGNGALDVALLDSRGRLRFLMQGEGRQGEGAAPIAEIALGRAESLLVGDLDGNGADDLVVATERGLRSLTGLTSSPRLEDLGQLPPEGRSLELFDADGDGHRDLLAASADTIRIRLGDGRGGFGPWLVERVDRLHTLFEGAGHDGRPTIATLEGARDGLVEYVLEHGAEHAKPSLVLHPLALQQRGSLPHVHGDVDGDGDLDLVVADKNAAQLHYFLEEGSEETSDKENAESILHDKLERGAYRGRFRHVVAPCLAGVQSLALGDIDGDTKPDLIVCSPEENLLAWRSGAAALDSFPRPLPMAETPLAACVHEGRLLVLARTRSRAGVLLHVRPDADSRPVSLCAFGRLGGEPVRLGAAELDGEPGAELFFVARAEGLRVLFAQGDGYFRTAEQALPGTGFTERIEDGALSLVEHEGRPALLVVREQYARTFRFDGDRAPLVLHQDAGPEGQGGLRLGCELESGTRVYLNKDASRLVWGEAGRPAQIAEIPELGAQYVLAHHGHVLVLGDQGVLRVDPHGRGPRLQRLRALEPLTPETDWYLGRAVDLDHDGKNEIVLADAHTHGLHVLVCAGATVRPALLFPVFEVPVAEGFEYEPRELVTGDLDGDGRADLALLCLDRLLVYLQEH